MNTPSEQDSHAVRLALAVKHLRVRLQEAALAGATGVSLSQLSILRRLRNEGAATTAALAAAEHVSHQAVAQNLTGLKEMGLIEATPDPHDGRKKLISVTVAGQALFESASVSRNAWLAEAIDSTITAGELPDLDKAIELLERLAAAGNSGKTR